MIETTAIKNNLLASMEVALFMRTGIKRFKNTQQDMLKSFLIPVLLLPVTIFTLLYAHPNQDMSAGSAQALTLIYSARLFLYLGCFIAFVYAVSKAMDKTEEFRSFVIANNWLTIPVSAMMLIPLSLYIGGAHEGAAIYSLIVMITLYSFACTAFIATYMMRIPYEMAAFIAITGLLIHHNALDFVKWAALNTLDFLA